MAPALIPSTIPRPTWDNTPTGLLPVTLPTIWSTLPSMARFSRILSFFSIATSETWRDKTSNEKQERTEWHNIVCFAKLGEIAGEYLKKGSKVFIEGSLRTSSWEADGVKKYRTEVIARDMQMLDSRGMGGGMGGGQAGGQGDGGYNQAPQGQPAQSAAHDGAAMVADDDFDDDIPF